MTRDRSKLFRCCSTDGCSSRPMLGKTTCRRCDPDLDMSKAKRGLCVMKTCTSALHDGHHCRVYLCASCAKKRVVFQGKLYREAHRYIPFPNASEVSNPEADERARQARRAFLRDVRDVNAHTLQHASPERFAETINKILRGQMDFA